jgi:hypothetical protein
MRTNSSNILAGTPEENKLLGRPTGTWEDNIKIDIAEIEVTVLTGFIWLRIATCVGFF